MRGLLHIPGESALAQVYALLQTRGRIASPKELALWSQWCRFDPRLAEQWVAHVGAQWRSISPLLLQASLVEQPWRAALAALLEQVDALWIARLEKKVFRAWATLATEGSAPAPFEQFFIGLLAPGGKQMRKCAERGLKSFLKWGYLCDEVLINKARSQDAKTQLPRGSRLRILHELAASQHSFTVEEYLHALGPGVHRRQAQRDLQREKGLRASGETRGRRYRRG